MSSPELSRLVIDLAVGERLSIGAGPGQEPVAVIEFVRKSGRVTRLKVIAPKAVPVRKVSQQEEAALPSS